MAERIYKKAAILGPGLVGASLGLALKARGLAGRVVGLARRESTLETATRVGAIDAGTRRLEEALEGADLVIFAAPVLATVALMEQVGRATGRFAEANRIGGLANGAFLTDVCSTKARVMEAAARSLPGTAFVGGHPMAGGESSGPENSRADLFVGATWVITPGAQTSAEAVSQAEALARGLGAKPLLLSAEVHDELAAAVSHLPHLLATALMAQAGEAAAKHAETWRVAARGFKDMTRLAGGNPGVWKDICLTNAAPLVRALAAFRRRLEEMEAWLQEEDAQALEEALKGAREQQTRLTEANTGRV